MNRDELLTKLAMELGEWPSKWTDECRKEIPEVAHWDMLGAKTFLAGSHGKHIEKIDWLQRRAELINKPSWDDAPEWAKWLAQDYDGGWWFFNGQPEQGADFWYHGDHPGDGRFGQYHQLGAIPAGHAWRQTLEKRPEFNESRADTIGQNGDDGQHYCTDGQPCGESPIPGDDAYCIGCPAAPDVETAHLCNRCGGSYYSPPHDECPCSSGRSDGSTASYYELPPGATELQDLISYRNLNAQDGEIFRAVYRKGRASHSDALRDAKKVLFYAEAEVRRLEAYGE